MLLFFEKSRSLKFLNGFFVHPYSSDHDIGPWRFMRVEIVNKVENRQESVDMEVDEGQPKTFECNTQLKIYTHSS